MMSFSTQLKKSPPAYYVVIYKINIYYYLSKSLDLSKNSFDQNYMLMDFF